MGSERGQAAVEFAMVVPLLCLIIIAILHFGKVMNYWLDLNHVASEAARKVAVKTYASYGEYRTFACDRLETNELRTGGTSSIPNPATVAICLSGDHQRGRRPGQGRGLRQLQPAVHRNHGHVARQRDHAARAVDERGRRGSVRVSTNRALAEIAREDGGIVVLVAMLLPFVMLFLALSVDIGNWWVHKRHLQHQVDAAALAGGALFGECFSDPAAA